MRGKEFTEMIYQSSTTNLLKSKVSQNFTIIYDLTAMLLICCYKYQNYSKLLTNSWCRSNVAVMSTLC